MNGGPDVFVVSPEHLTRVNFKEIKEGDVIKCTCPDDSHWDYRFISTAHALCVSGLWIKEKNGAAGGCSIPPNTDWILERVESPAVNHIRAFYNEIRLETFALHCMVMFRGCNGHVRCREITVTGADLWQQIENETGRLKEVFGEVISLSHTLLPLDVPHRI